MCGGPTKDVVVLNASLTALDEAEITIACGQTLNWLLV